MGLVSSRVLWNMVGGPMPRGLLGIGSGDIARDAYGPVLYLGGYSTSFRNRLYSARLAGHDGTTWLVDHDSRGRARPLLHDPPRAAWDAGGMHTPSYLPPRDGHPARIYYAGRGGRRHTGRGSRYSIGLLEQEEGGWRRRAAPLITGDSDRPSALEPRVVHDGDSYVMWYLATPHEVAPGEQPDYELRSVSSADGVTGWSEPVRFADPAEGFFDVALAPIGGRWLMVLAAGTNLHGTTPYPPQGLWVITSATPSPDRAAWTAPRRILDTDLATTPDWMGAGVCDPAIDATRDGRLTVYVTGTRRHRSWPLLAVQQLRLGRMPPPPAPYQLATAVLEFAVDE